LGSDLWRGEAEAAEALQWTVDKADAGGQLRGILDAVRSNRVEDDFSEHWSYAREDFERKLWGIGEHSASLRAGSSPCAARS